MNIQAKGRAGGLEAAHEMERALGVSVRRRCGQERDNDSPGSSKRKGLAGISAAIDIRDASSLPDWFRGIPLRAQQVLGLMSLGFTDVQIARNFRIEAYSVRDYRRRYLKKGQIIGLTAAERAALQRGLVEARAIQAVTSITNEDLKQATVGEKAHIAVMLVEIAEKLGRKHTTKPVDFSDLLDRQDLYLGPR